MSSSADGAQERRLACPGCAVGRVSGEGHTVCSGKRCRVEVIRFPVVAELVPDAGAGRCARHPTKDGVASCGRCGGFVCEVCATRTGEQVLCPTCFDLLHERGELGTTKTTRFRMDQLALALAVIPCACSPFVLTLPVALWLGIQGLRRAQRDTWISKPLCWTAIGLTSLYVVGGAVALVVALIEAGKGE